MESFLIFLIQRVLRVSINAQGDHFRLVCLNFNTYIRGMSAILSILQKQQALETTPYFVEFC